MSGRMEVWRKQRMGTAGVWDLEGDGKGAFGLSGLSAGGYGRWDKAVPGKGTCLNAQLPDL